MVLARLILLSAIVLSAGSVQAYIATEHVTAKPYDVIYLSAPYNREQIVFGQLADNPDMVELVSDEEFTFKLSLRALPGTTTPLLNGIIVEVLEPRGVKEIARLKSTESSWETKRDFQSGLLYRVGPTYEATLPAGTYRVEVSTPDNLAAYMMVLGVNEEPTTYMESWQAVRALYNFYGTPAILLVRSPLIYYPVGILLLLIGFGYTIWRTRDRLPFLKRYV